MAADSRGGLIGAFAAAAYKINELERKLRRRQQPFWERIMTTMLKGTAVAVLAVVVLQLLPTLGEAHSKKNPQRIDELEFLDWNACKADCRRKLVVESKACARKDQKKRMSDTMLMRFKTPRELADEAGKAQNCTNPIVPLPPENPIAAGERQKEKTQAAQGNNTELDKKQAQVYNAPEGQVLPQSPTNPEKEAEMAKTTFLAAAIAAAITIAPAAVQAKQTETINSPRYAQYIATCGWSHIPQGDRATVAKKFDNMSEEQFKLQMQNYCPKRDDNEKMTRQAQASRPDVDVDVNVHPTPAPAYRHGPAFRPGYGGGRAVPLSSAEEAQLNGLLSRKAVQLLGSRPPNSRGFVGTRRHFEKVRPGCTERRVHDAATRMTYVRVTCQ